MDLTTVLRNKGGEVITIRPDAIVSEAVDTLGERRIGALVVTENGRVTGIFSERDVIYCLRQSGGQVLDWHTGKALHYGKPRRRNPRLLALRAPYRREAFKLKEYESELL